MHLKVTIEIEGRQAGIIERDLQGTAEEVEEQAREATRRTLCANIPIGKHNQILIRSRRERILLSSNR